jgi:hypothetical protein
MVKAVDPEHHGMNTPLHHCGQAHQPMAATDSRNAIEF